jgi:uncharacterized protein
MRTCATPEPTRSGSLPTLSAADARRLLLAGQGLLAEPARRAGPAAAEKIVRQLGFVQVDSIQRIERAHHLILGARLDDYRADHLDHAAFRRRALFEHWTHDAALIPTEWFEYWKPRFERTEARLRRSKWFTARLGADPDTTLERVHARIAEEGPLRTSDFERGDRPSTGWWDWTPEKAALEFLWHSGRLAIHGRERFQKIYDLTERVFPEPHERPAPRPDAHVDWACREALARLGVATPGELAAFFAAITPAEAAAWSRASVARGVAVEVLVESVDGAKPRRALARPDWERVLRRAPSPPDRIRLLAPFDPLIRDRKRLQRLFGFDYRFEAFVPAARRRYGYYVLPILEGDRLVGRLDPRHDRERRALVVERIWWEAGVRPTRARVRKLRDALELLARQIGADQVVMSAG